MPESEQPVKETIEQIVERVTFSDPDPRIQHLKGIWEDAKAQERHVFNQICRQEYIQRLECHRVLGTPNPEEVAKREADLCALLFREEMEARLDERWAAMQRRVAAVLEEKREDECPG